MKTTDKSLKATSYKQLRSDLDQTIIRLQSDDLDLEEAIKLYKKSQLLIKDLKIYLTSAEVTIKEIKADFNKDN